MPRKASTTSVEPKAAKPRRKPAAKRPAAKRAPTVRKKTVRKPAAKRPAVEPVWQAPVNTAVAHGHAVHDHEEHLRQPVRRPAQLDPRSKRLVMWIGISVIMTVLLVGWILSLTQLIGPDVKASTETNQTEIDLTSLKEEINQAMADVKGSLDEFRALSTEESVTGTAVPATDSAFEKFKDTVEQSAEPVTSTAFPNTLPE